MDQVVELRARLLTLERRQRRSYGVLALIVLLAVAPAARPSASVLRVRGVVIVDALGRERLVLGSPLSGVAGDTELAGTSGIAVLDSAGRPSIVVGANPPNLTSQGSKGRHTLASVGITLYDPRDGEERVGITAAANGQASMCLDYAALNKEAICLSVAPNDLYSAIMLNATPNQASFERVGMFVGSDGVGALKAFGGGSNRSGMILRGGKGAPTLTLYDSTATIMQELARVP